MTTITHNNAARISRIETLEKAAVASIEAAWACEALDGSGRVSIEEQGAAISQAHSAAKAWKLAGMAWHIMLDPPASDTPNGELGLALKASGRALMRTCTSGLEPAQGDALLAWEAAKVAWNTLAARPEALFAAPAADDP